MTISISSNATLAEALTRIDGGTGPQENKDSLQIRIQSRAENPVTGEVIFQTELKQHTYKSVAETAKALHLTKFFAGKVSAHDKKVDNWDVFKDLAKNQLAQQLKDIPGVKVNASQIDDLVEGVFEKYITFNPEYKAHEVRLGAAQGLSRLVDDIADKAKANSQEFADRLKQLPAGDQRVLTNPTYGSVPAATGGVSDDYEALAFDNYEPLPFFNGEAAGQSEGLAPKINRAQLMARQQIAIDDGDTQYARTSQVNRSRPNSPVDNGGDYASIRSNSAEQYSAYGDDNVLGAHRFVTSKAPSEVTQEEDGIYEAVVHESEVYGEIDYGKKNEARRLENERLGAPAVPPRNY